MSNRLKISLIMPVLNEENSIEYTLNAVFSSSRLPDEIIIADAFSTDQTQAKIRQFERDEVPIKIVDNPGIFAGSGRNEAVKESSGDIILLLDFGNIIEEKWIEEMVMPFENDSSVDSVAGVFKPFTQSAYEQCVAAIQYYQQMSFNKLPRNEQDKLKPKCAKPGGLGLAITRYYWDKLGGMPCWLRAGEDYIFSRKVCLMGLTVYPALDAVLHHHIRSDSRQVYKQNFIYNKGSSQIGMMDKNCFFIVAFYCCLILLIVGSIWMPVYLFVALFLMTSYTYYLGVRRIAKIYSPLPDNCWLYSFIILIARDIGILLGSLVGWIDWKTQKKYKKLFSTYFNDEVFAKIKK